MRLFVAVLPPSDVVAELDAVIAPHRAAWPQLRWVWPGLWHLTLAFLGEVTESVPAELDIRLARLAKDNCARQLFFSGAGIFPAHDRSTALWTGVDGDRTELISLAGSVNAEARRAGASDTDPKRMHPHLTLARCEPPFDVDPLRAELARFRGKPWQAAEIHLLRSHLGPQAHYRTVGSYRLARTTK